MAGRSRQYDHLLKYVIVGNSSVGKSCLLLRFADDQFSQNYMATIGVDFRFKTISVSNRNIKLQIWDTAGQQRFRTITNTYYKSAHAVILVYDITNIQSFKSLEQFWLGEIQSYADPGTKLILIGNKSDLKQQQIISTQQVIKFANEKGMLFFETSAKTSQHVNDCFIKITENLVQELQQNKNKKKQQIHQGINLNNDKKNNSQSTYSCCHY